MKLTINSIILLLSIIAVYHPVFAENKSGITETEQIVAILPFYNLANDSLEVKRYFSETSRIFTGISNFSVLKSEAVKTLFESKYKDEQYYELNTLVSFGQEIEADIVVTGVLQQMRDIISLELRICEVKEKRFKSIERIELEYDNPEINQIISDEIQIIVDQLQIEPGILYVETIPSESRVDIDYQALGFSPIRKELAGNQEHSIVVKRIGFESEQRIVFLDSGDSLNVKIKLKKQRKIKENEVNINIRAYAGLPYNQSSSNLDTRFSLGDGDSYGVAVSFGYTWCIQFAYLYYNNMLSDMDEEYWMEYGALDEPNAKAHSISSNLVYSYPFRTVSPFIGFGIGILSEEIKVNLNSDSEKEEERSSEFEVALSLEAGMNINLSKRLSMQFGAIHTRKIGSEDSWKLPDEVVDEFWEKAFREFKSFTVMRIGMGYKF